MRKIILIAIAAFVWKKIQARKAAADMTESPRI
jgi:hypothetical protein